MNVLLKLVTLSLAMPVWYSVSSQKSVSYTLATHKIYIFLND